MRKQPLIVSMCRLIGILLMVLINGCRERAKPQAANPPSTTNQSAVSSEAIEKSLSAAQAYLDSQDIAKAQAILFTLLDRAPNEFRAREMLGQTFVIAATQSQQRGDEEVSKELRAKAYEQYRLVAAAAEDSAELQHSAGLMAMQASDSAAALEHFQKAARLDPNSPKFPLYEAQVLIQIGQLQQAETSLNQVLRLDIDEALAHASLAMIALTREKFDEAMMHIAQARSIQPTDLGLRVQEAKICRRAGQPQRALELLIGLSDAERAKEFVAYEVAGSYNAMDRHADAAGAWQHAYRANPASPNAWLHAVRAGECWLRAGRREDAMFWLQQAQPAAPNAPEVKELHEAIARTPAAS